MDIGWHVIWRIKCANANEPDYGASTRIVAPYCHPAFWAARDLLAPPAIGGRVDHLRLRTQMHHVICFNHGIQCERGAAFSLAPTTMAAVYKQRLPYHTIADRTAIAAPVERKDIACDHACDVSLSESRLAQCNEACDLRKSSGASPSRQTRAVPLFRVIEDWRTAFERLLPGTSFCSVQVRSWAKSGPPRIRLGFPKTVVPLQRSNNGRRICTARPAT